MGEWVDRVGALSIDLMVDRLRVSKSISGSEDYSIPAYKSTTILIAATRISAAIRTMTV